MEKYWKQLDQVLLDHWKLRVVALNGQVIMADCDWEIYFEFRIIAFFVYKRWQEDVSASSVATVQYKSMHTAKKHSLHRSN